MHERSKPLTLLLDIWYYDRDIHVIHAGFVAWQGQGVLVGGASGDGKTTTTLACLLDGFDYLADDQTGLQALEDGSFAGHSLYSGARLEPRHAKNFLRLLPNAIPSDRIRGDKVLVFLTEALPEQVARRAPVRAIILPRVIPQERSFLRRASETEALLRLAPSSLFTAFGPGRRGFERLARLVERVPSYWLELGSDLAAIPGCVRGLLNGSLPQH